VHTEIVVCTHLILPVLILEFETFISWRVLLCSVTYVSLSVKVCFEFTLLAEDKVGVVSMLSCLCVQVSTVTMAQPQGHFGYQIVRIIKTSSLGVGSYGAVYRALCDELPCAAKVIHPTLFETHDPGARKIMERFEQECQFLSDVRHPNITQYVHG